MSRPVRIIHLYSVMEVIVDSLTFCHSRAFDVLKICPNGNVHVNNIQFSTETTL
jgi:hypothetical protein